MINLKGATNSPQVHRVRARGCMHGAPQLALGVGCATMIALSLSRAQQSSELFTLPHRRGIDSECKHAADDDTIFISYSLFGKILAQIFV